MRLSRPGVRSRLLSSLLLGVTLSACKSISIEPFRELSESIQQLREGAEAALQVIDEANRERFISETVADSAGPEGAEAISGLLIEGVEDDPFGWTLERTPLFMASQRFRRGVYALNSALLAYSELMKNGASYWPESSRPVRGATRPHDGRT